jgi:exopolysaccharide biosynthesis polyprenyl glycosylphosphotransferase
VVYINVDWTQYTGLKILIAALQREPVAVRIFPDATMMGSLKRPHMSSDGSLALEVQRPPMTATASLQKRILDLTFSILALTAFLPIIAIIGLAIRLDSGGPVIFRQTRRGFKDSVFRIYKFRTMTVLEDGPMVTQAKHNDPRVTRVGRLLRRTSLDELPQLLNVIKGDMSLVGPRPHAVAHDIEFDRLVSGYELRSYVKPGITGWAQVHGMRGETSTIDLIRKRVDLDIYYVRNHTLLLDIEILAKTIVHLFRHYNAE